jgi:hypothetical protein
MLLYQWTVPVLLRTAAQPTSLYELVSRMMPRRNITILSTEGSHVIALVHKIRAFELSKPCAPKTLSQTSVMNMTAEEWEVS